MNHRSLFTAARRRTNRQFFALTLPLLLLGLAVGCSSSSPAAPASADSQDSSQQTRVVKHLSGETKVPNHPSKIAVLDYRLADSLLALGVTPYAMTTFLGQTNLPYIEGKPLAKTLALGDTPNLEAVLQAGPDLILARKPEQKVYDQLSQVAPTVILDIPSDWRQAFREVGTVVGHEKQAEEWLSNYDKKAADIRSEISGYVKPGSTFLYLRIMPKEIRVHGTQELFGATLFQDLKLTPVPGLEQVKRIEPISLEKLPDYDADYIFLQVGSPSAGGDKQAEENLASIAESPIWKNLKAVKNGRVYTMPSWIISDYPNIKSKSLELVRDSLKQPSAARP